MVKCENHRNSGDFKAPEFSIIIPHLKGIDNLYRCLKSIYERTDEKFEIILVDNGSKDNSIQIIYSRFPDIILVRSEKNLGFAGGCNTGIKKARGKYIVLLNDDVQVTKNWLKEVARLFKEDERCAACQPKLLSYEDKGFFEYAGSCGGFIDRYCFPFTRGRIFETIEADHNQYDNEKEIFWGAGAALIFRKKLVDKIGYLDEDFFAHMEEIDFCFRVHLAGYKIYSVPKSVIYHKTASTLKPSSFIKMFLNHRNSLYLMLKNYPLKALIKNIFVRILLDFSAFCYSLAKCEFKRAIAIILSYFSCMGEISKIIRKRREMAKYFREFYSRVYPKLFPGSIALTYYLLRKHRFSDIDCSFVSRC